MPSFAFGSTWPNRLLASLKHRTLLQGIGRSPPFTQSLSLNTSGAATASIEYAAVRGINYGTINDDRVIGLVKGKVGEVMDRSILSGPNSHRRIGKRSR